MILIMIFVMSYTHFFYHDFSQSSILLLLVIVFFLKLITELVCHAV